MKYKAKITKKDFDDFVSYYQEQKNVEKTKKEFPNEIKKYQDPDIEIMYKMFNLHFMNNPKYKNRFDLNDKDNYNYKLLADYCADNDLLWNVERLTDNYCILSFSGNRMFWKNTFCMFVEMPDYESLSLNEIKHSINEEYSTNMLPAEMYGLTVSSVKEEKGKLENKERELKKLKEDISLCKDEELRRMEKEIQKLQNALSEKKREMLAEMDEKLRELQEKMNECNKTIYMLKSEIYAIRCFQGETVELKKVRGGKKADITTPLVVNQKMLYLDEDLARIVSIYQKEISQKYELFEDAIKYDEPTFESFCPQERSLTFFRISRDASYRYYDPDKKMYLRESLIHGKKIGFVLRNGEEAFLGWLDESWDRNDKGEPVPLTFMEELMYHPEKNSSYQNVDDLNKLSNDNTNTMLSRVFALQVIQGILSEGKLLEFPDKVNVLKPSPYIIYNFANAWITDDRFGDFATLVENLNKRTKVKDSILVCYHKHSCTGRGEADRAHDCEVPEGLNKVNYLDSDKYGHSTIYVSAKKKWSLKNATANVLLRKNEYINITYMNSIWLSYYVQTKKLGNYAEDYAKMVKYFKIAIEKLKERETMEIEAVKKYFEDADKIPEWEIKLSHWKINHEIRFITDFQAKRVAKYLKEGKFEENKNLFCKESFYDHIDSTNNNMFTRTNFSLLSLFSKVDENATEFAKDSAYNLQNFYINNLNKGWNLSEEDKEKNKELIRDFAIKSEKIVPDRVIQDERKLQLVRDFVLGFMKEHRLKPEVLSVKLLGINVEDSLKYIKVDELKKEERTAFYNLVQNMYEDYILTSDCWKIAYYDFIQSQYDAVLEECRRILHERFMKDII